VPKFWATRAIKPQTNPFLDVSIRAAQTNNKHAEKPRIRVSTPTYIGTAASTTRKTAAIRIPIETDFVSNMGVTDAGPL
jgi:hypothetical protein